MNARRSTWWVVGIWCVTMAATTRADDAPWWNPFGKKDAPKQRAKADSKPWFGGAKRSSEPSAWDRFSNGTKSAYSKTKDALTPWKADPPKSSRQVSTARRSTHVAQHHDDKKSSLSSWWPKKQEPEREVKTVNDFLALPPVPY